MEISTRLKAVMDMIPVCTVLADIGTDHAYIPVFCIKNRICSKAIATDIREGPLRIAANTIEKYGLKDLIETRIGNGLSCIKENEADVIVIAGVGGMLAADILEKEAKKAESARALIIQPMNSIEVVRAWLYENGYEIYDETLAADESKIYCIIAARRAVADCGYCTAGRVDEIYCHVGMKLIEKRQPLLKEYLLRMLARFNKIIYGMQKSRNRNPDDVREYIHLKNKIEEIIASISS